MALSPSYGGDKHDQVYGERRLVLCIFIAAVARSSLDRAGLIEAGRARMQH